MESKLKELWVLAVLLLVSNWQHWTYGNLIPQVPCYFAFGDSLFDNGNNNYLDTPFKANFLPHGVDFPHGATGRWSNGLNIADAIAALLGFDIDSIPPFGAGGPPSVLNGVNYASAGVGILDESGDTGGKLYTMNLQLYNHKIIASRIAKILGSEEVAKKYLSQCLYVSAMGHNDYLNNYFLDTYNTSKLYNLTEFANLLVKDYEAQLEVLYDTGARKIAVFGLLRFGCFPYNVEIFHNELDAEPCAYKLNDAAKIFNRKLRVMLQKLNFKHLDAKFAYINSYDIDFLTNKGFKNNNQSCCKRPYESPSCEHISIPCNNRSEHVYWSGAHFTEAKVWEFAKIAYKGRTRKNAYPYDVSELVRLKLDNSDGYDISELVRLKLDNSDAYDINHAQI